MAQAAFARPDLKKVLSVAQLPALPQSAMRLLELSQDPENGPIEYAVPIESDPGLAGQVLRFVNSSYFGFSREISSVRLAITLVGVRTIKNFALWNAVFNLMPNPKCGPFDLKCLWQDSLRRALFARAVGRLQGVREAEEAFSAALLQDMAVPLLAKAAPEAYIRLLHARDQGRVQLSLLERRVFGWTHAEAGGIVARQWNLPENLAVLVENHLVTDWEFNGSPTGGSAVALSTLLPAANDSVWPDCVELETRYGQVCPSGNPPLLELLVQVDRECADFAPLWRLSAPAKTLVQSYDEVVSGAGAAVVA